MKQKKDRRETKRTIPTCWPLEELRCPPERGVRFAGIECRGKLRGDRIAKDEPPRSSAKRGVLRPCVRMVRVWQPLARARVAIQHRGRLHATGTQLFRGHRSGARSGLQQDLPRCARGPRGWTLAAHRLGRRGYVVGRDCRQSADWSDASVGRWHPGERGQSARPRLAVLRSTRQLGPPRLAVSDAVGRQSLDERCRAQASPRQGDRAPSLSGQKNVTIASPHLPKNNEQIRDRNSHHEE